METIVKPYSKIMRYIPRGLQHTGTPFHWCTFLQTVQVDDGQLIRNALTGEVVLITADEKLDEAALREKLFLIDDAIDEYTLARMLKAEQRYAGTEPRMSRIKSAVIYTTTDCNASCPYCFERGTRRRYMQPDTAREIALSLGKHASDKIRLTWFGGEPLLNWAAMDEICSYLKNNGVAVTSKIITNGVLAGNITFDDAEAINLKSVQITLDGMPEAYERIKGLNPGGFDLVIDNINHLLSLGVAVNIRLNVDGQNGPEMVQLVEYIHEHCTSQIKKPVVYAHMIFGMDGDGKRDAAEWIIKAEKRAHELGIGKSYKLHPPKSHHCMADSNRSVVINPEGQITVCEQYCDDELVGDIWKGPQRGKLAAWAEEYESDDCRFCEFYPECRALKKCPNSGDCDSNTRAVKMYETREAIKNAYSEFLERGEVIDVEANRNSNRRGRLPLRGR